MVKVLLGGVLAPPPSCVSVGGVLAPPPVAGLSLLLPHLLTQDNKWKNCKLRIFTAGSPQQIDSAALRYRQPSCCYDS